MDRCPCLIEERSTLSPCLARLTHEHSFTVRRRRARRQSHSNSGGMLQCSSLCPSAWKTQNPVKCGGVLVYSVCESLKEERTCAHFEMSQGFYFTTRRSKGYHGDRVANREARHEDGYSYGCLSWNCVGFTASFLLSSF